MLRVRDIMTEGVFTLDALASTEEAAWALTRRHIGGAPVRDKTGNLIGVVTTTDLLDPAPRDWIAGEGTVADRMSPVVYAVYADDPALAAAEIMELRGVHRLLVIGNDGKPAGIVSTTDVNTAVAHGKSFGVEGDDV